MISIAVIFSCFNRKEKTMKCIEGLLNQKCKINYMLDFYICDDCSTDGTVQQIKKLVPNANVFVSKGNLYWCKSMFFAMNMAISKKHDFYLMINDDMEFYDSALQTMMDSFQQVNFPCGIVGSVLSLDEKKITYGGRIYTKKLKMGKSILLSPSQPLIECDIAHWNCFMITQEVIDKVGLIDYRYEHAIGDYDYSLMMKRKGFKIYIAKDYVGKTDINSIEGTYRDKTIARNIRLKNMFSVKGRPVKSEFLFYVKNHGLIGFLFFIYEYIRLIFQIILGVEC